MKKTKNPNPMRIIALFLAVTILVAAALLSFAACGKEKSPDSTAPVFDRATWTDEDIVGHAAMLRFEFMTGPRTEPIVDGYGFEATMEGDTMTVYYPEGVHANESNHLQDIVVGRTFRGEFTLGNILPAYDAGEWVAMVAGGWTLSSRDYAKAARIEVNGDLYVNEIFVDNVAADATLFGIGCPLTAENLSEISDAYRKGAWSGRVIYDRSGNHAYISACGEIVINGEITNVWPALGPNEYVLDGFSMGGNTMILFKDGMIAVYDREGYPVTIIQATNPDQNLNPATSAILPEGFYVYSEEENIKVYLGTGGQDRMVEVDIKTGTVIRELNTLARLTGGEYASLIVYQVGATLYGIDRNGVDIPRLCGIASASPSKEDNRKLVVVTDTGASLQYVYNGDGLLPTK